MALCVSRVAAVFLAAALGVWLGCAPVEGTGRAGDTRASIVRAGYLADIDSLAASVTRLVEAAQASDSLGAPVQSAFIAARFALKRVEHLAAYYNPTTTELLNGPPIPRVDEDEGPDVIFPPEGFQVLEPLVFPTVNVTQRDAIVSEAQNIGELVTRLRTAAAATPITDDRVFDAVRLEIARVASLGITGFDAPLAMTAIPEAIVAVRAVTSALEPYGRDAPEAWAKVSHVARRALTMLSAARSFDDFDRLAFIRDGANPLSRAIAEMQRSLDIAPVDEQRAFVPSAMTIFDRDAIDPWAFASPFVERAPARAVDLGRRLFFEPALSGPGTRSCGSCHQPSRAFADGLPRSEPLGRRGAELRNAPTLINSALQAGSFYDLRTRFLEDQITQVVANPDEMHGSIETAAQRLTTRAEYRDAFAAAYGAGDSVITGMRLRSAIAAYLRSLVALNSRVDRHVRGEDALDDSERRGFNVFMGKARCGACHFAPLFNGTVPPNVHRCRDRGAWCSVARRHDERGRRSRSRPLSRDACGAASIRVQDADGAKCGAHRALHAQRCVSHAGRGDRFLRSRRRCGDRDLTPESDACARSLAPHARRESRLSSVSPGVDRYGRSVTRDG
jgi:cytochrome c peroxidase